MTKSKKQEEVAALEEVVTQEEEIKEEVKVEEVVEEKEEDTAAKVEVDEVAKLKAELEAANKTLNKLREYEKNWKKDTTKLEKLSSYIDSEIESLKQVAPHEIVESLDGLEKTKQLELLRKVIKLDKDLKNNIQPISLPKQKAPSDPLAELEGENDWRKIMARMKAGKL